MKFARIFLVVVLSLASFSLFNSVFAQSTQYNVKLGAYSLQVTYPADVTPGETVTVNVQGSPTVNGVYLQSLTATIYYTDSSGLRQLQTETLAVGSTPNAYNNFVSYGYYGSFDKSFTVNVPDNATATSLVAIFSETVMPKYQGWNPAYPNDQYYQSHYNNPTSYPYYSYYPYSLMYPYLPAYPYYPPYTTYTTPPYPAYSPSNGYGSDQAVASLSYVNATAPESVTLQSANQVLQQQINQTQAQNQQLQAKLSQQNSTLSQLNEQLTGINQTVETYQALSVVFAIVVVVFLAFSIVRLKSKKP